MDLRTTYMGLQLAHPLVPSASPLSYTLDGIRRMEDAGAAAVVMHSLFEEQIEGESHLLDHYLSYGSHSFAEALDYFPEMQRYNVGPHSYLELINAAKAATDIPIIASLNGVSTGGWIEYAKLMEEAGADGLELNIYYIPVDPAMDSAACRFQLPSRLAPISALLPIWPPGSVMPAPMRWCCSIASISLISTWKRWK